MKHEQIPELCGSRLSVSCTALRMSVCPAARQTRVALGAGIIVAACPSSALSSTNSNSITPGVPGDDYPVRAGDDADLFCVSGVTGLDATGICARSRSC
jgi:hypothetical protein